MSETACGWLWTETELAQSITARHFTAGLYEVLAAELVPTAGALEVAIRAALDEAEHANQTPGVFTSKS